MSQPLALASIRLDGGTQPRAVTDATAVEDYAQAMADGAQFPPVIVFHDGRDHWLAGGFHRYTAKSAIAVDPELTARYMASRQSERSGAWVPLDAILADIRQGTRRDAVLFSVGENADHGMRRTNEDKRRAVVRLLSDEEWRGWADADIARRCAVSDNLVATVRAELYPDAPRDSHRTYTHPKTGQPTLMSVTNMRAGPRESPFHSDVQTARGIPHQPISQRAERSRDLMIEETLRAASGAMAQLPNVRATVRAVPNFDLDIARRHARWWADFSDELRERGERVA